MSRVGSMPIPVPDGVEVRLEKDALHAKGKAGQRSYTLPREVEVSSADGQVVVTPRGNSKRVRQIWGTTRANLARLIAGVHTPFERRLEIEGVGYRAQVRGRELVLNLGFSHEVIYAIPEGIEIKAAKPTELLVTGMDWQQVGQVAAVIRAYRPPEPYKGKGVRYAGEHVRRKEGKKK